MSSSTNFIFSNLLSPKYQGKPVLRLHTLQQRNVPGFHSCCTGNHKIKKEKVHDSEEIKLLSTDRVYGLQVNQTKRTVQLTGQVLLHLLSNSENREHLKNFRNVDCVLANHKRSSGYISKPQNHKLITVAVCGIVTSRLFGLFLAKHSINIYGVHGCF